MSKITNIGVERELTGGEMKRERKDMKEKKEMDERARLYDDISSWSETERRNEMLLQAAFI